MRFIDKNGKQKKCSSCRHAHVNVRPFVIRIKRKDEKARVVALCTPCSIDHSIHWPFGGMTLELKEIR